MLEWGVPCLKQSLNLPCFWGHCGDSGVSDNGNEWRKFRVVPRSHPLRPLGCTLVNRGGNKSAFRLPGEGRDHFHCTVEPSLGSYLGVGGWVLGWVCDGGESCGGGDGPGLESGLGGVCFSLPCDF